MRERTRPTRDHRLQCRGVEGFRIVISSMARKRAVRTSTKPLQTREPPGSINAGRLLAANQRGHFSEMPAKLVTLKAGDPSRPATAPEESVTVPTSVAVVSWDA